MGYGQHPYEAGTRSWQVEFAHACRERMGTSSARVVGCRAEATPLPEGIPAPALLDAVVGLPALLQVCRELVVAVGLVNSSTAPGEPSRIARAVSAPTRAERRAPATTPPPEIGSTASEASPTASHGERRSRRRSRWLDG